jgi:hypothetical protein
MPGLGVKRGCIDRYLATIGPAAFEEIYGDFLAFIKSPE